MGYDLKGGESWIDGLLHGWTGRECPICKGQGLASGDYVERPCLGCGGTGEEHGLMPIQPSDVSL